MNPDSITVLRADSLAATLAAARGRRVRRRAGRIAGAVFVFATVLLFLLPRRNPAPALIAAPRPIAAAQCFPPAPAAFARIATHESATLVRLHTAPESRVERIDTAGLTRCFPEQGIAVIQPAGELAKVVLF